MSCMLMTSFGDVIHG